MNEDPLTDLGLRLTIAAVEALFAELSGCSHAVVVRSLWLRVAKQFPSCAFVQGQAFVLPHFYKGKASRGRRERFS